MNKIQNKLLLGFIIVIVVGLIPPTVYLNNTALNQSTAEISNKLKSHISSFLLYLQESSEELNTAARKYADAAGVRITLIDKQGVVIGESNLSKNQVANMENHSTRPEILQAGKEGTGIASRYSTTLKQQFIYIARKIDSNPQFQYIRIAQSLKAVTALANDFRRNLFITMTILAALLVGMLIYLKKRIHEPLTELTSVAREIGNGNLQSRAKIQSNDEIGDLTRIMNQMASTLQDDFEQIRKMAKVRTEFLGNVTHELKTPISTISGYLETLLDGAIFDTKVNKSFLKKSLKNANRLEALVTDLVEISRIESGELKMNFNKFNIYPLLRTFLDDTFQQNKNNNVEIKLEVPDKELFVFGDENRLEQVVDNLVSNAKRYTDEGYIYIRVKREENEMIFSFQDTGLGIQKESIDRIFERFYRTDKARDRIKGGTGLGLAITKHIVEAHQSHIDVESKEGEGSEFSFRLPINPQKKNLP